MPLKHQKENFNEFLKSESSLINKTLISDAFNKQTSNPPSWETASFFPGSIDNPTEIRGNWKEDNLEPTGNGLQIRSLILRSKAKIALNSIAVEVKLSFRLIGDSTIWILSRSSGVLDPEGVICKIKKEQETQRVFLIFGANIGKGNEFKFFKKQEIPEMFKFGEELMQDYVDLKIKFIDNGDDKVFVKANVGKDKFIEMSCDKYIPCFRDSHIMIAGSGDSIILKNVSVRHTPRIFGRPNMTRYECCELF